MVSQSTHPREFLLKVEGALHRGIRNHLTKRKQAVVMSAFRDAVRGTEPLQPSAGSESLANEIRRVDGNHRLGAAALADALMPFLQERGFQMPESPE